jgi:hypothetical protein
MTRKTKALCVALAALTAVIATACKNKDEETTAASATSVVTTVQTTETVTEATETPNTAVEEVTEDNDTTPEESVTESVTEAVKTVPAVTDSNNNINTEDMVQVATDVANLANLGYQAIQSNDFESMVRYTNVGIYCYMNTNSVPDDLTLVEQMSSRYAAGDDMYNFSYLANKSNVQFIAVSHCSDDEISGLNSIAENVNDTLRVAGYDYDGSILDAYKVFITYDGELESIEPCVYVIEDASGIWKLDVYYKEIKDVVDMLKAEEETIFAEIEAESNN